jgi:phosphatidylglycerophosphate synthase
MLDEDKARDERHNQWVVFFLLRPLSRRLAPALSRRGATADQVTWAGIGLSLALPLAALLPLPAAAPLVALGAVLFLLLDCVDGDIARASGTATRWGHYLDMVADVVFRCAFYLALGLLAGQAPIGLAAAWLSLGARWCRTWMTAELPERTDPYFEAGRTRQPRPADYLFFFVTGLDQTLPALLLAAAWGGWLGGLMWAVAAYSALDFAVTQLMARRRLA